MRTFLICHAGDKLNEIALPRWLASFSELAGVVVIHEPPGRLWKRVRREIKRVGVARFADVLAFRFYNLLVHSGSDRTWEAKRLAELCRTFPAEAAPRLYTSSPNSSDAYTFIRECKPDLIIARCKTLLKEEVFLIPRSGTFVMHPGVCPEYRNAHGCFWALANDDVDRVGMTLLKIDRGVDTGAVYGYYGCEFDETADSHTVIQHRVVFDNLDALRKKLEDVHAGCAAPIDTSGRKSAAWGQPWLSQYLRWKSRARRRTRKRVLAA